MTDELILACYKLAKFYSQPPDVFLNQPISRIASHCSWTDRLSEMMRGDEDDGR